MGSEAMPLLLGRDISKSFGRGRGRRAALTQVSLSLQSGECLALVGGSGSGKTTLSRILLGLESHDTGSVLYRGQEVDGRRSAGYRALRRESALVFQNPFASLDPRWPALRSIGEPLRIQARRLGLSEGQIRRRSLEALEQVGLEPASFAGRYPADCSGGQAQRLAVARAIVSQPKLLVADEPMSSLDVSARLGLLDTFRSIRALRPQTAIVMVSHDLGVVQHMADRILVLQEGRVAEEGPTGRVLAQPSCPYTRSLIAAASR
ncbi:ABC transporter ATP-binding protein [Bifidobacterium xylocopae]|uniref:Dipeptide/oligopeptide/nickel ABC transporter ATP-binding protein n=1 Tax=Bifidobacterium xylocopae TaxID=2493119 RepID=A0A366KEY7_9BIFI|nr:dipeptide/oligopeptide/nickel ABC transporter ATP-binding protein [Bifidobacterium xylocopae]RBQ00130.1 dipeptide/oligopeptide/nickel ABC transporter ATP-binding protein [Bifidobacterium xylocopae]